MTVGEQQAWHDLAAEATAGASLVALEQAACQLARARWARERIHVDGMIVLDARDRPVQHPAVAVEKSAQEAVRRWLDSLVDADAKPVLAVDRLDELAAARERRRGEVAG